MANSTSCSAGKTILIDPNSFDGQSSFSNVSVPLEDMAISVQLETNRKARTILTSTGAKNVGNSTEKITLRFIEGSVINGEKVLTTKFTDLTTSFEDGGDGESLGITSIDIDFNSSYAPMINITFVDVRGSSVFQNEENISSGKNKYSTFFQLPYPIYSLTVKGYYGMPVNYQLHMTKFNAKFNSQTGNFEISANFIGYTYAMLSDMLLGYLKAIPYTAIGAARYAKINAERLATTPVALAPILTLDELMFKISQIDVTTQKIKATDPDAAQLSNGKQKQEDLDTLKIILLNLGQSLDVIDDQSIDYRFILTKPNTDSTAAFKKYNDDITAAIDVYNKDNTITINESDFSNKIVYNDLSVNLLTESSVVTTETDRKQILYNKFNCCKQGPITSGDFDKIRTNILSLANKRGFVGDATFDVIDLRKKYDIIKEKNDAIIVEVDKLRKALANKLRLKVAETLGIDPSIRNIVSIFTTAVEVMLGVLFDVSAAAIKPTNLARTAQLKKFKDVDGAYDIRTSTINDTTSSSPSGSLIPLYYPWPDYRVEDTVEGLVETYLGQSGILDIPSDVNELEFIDDLLQAFLTSKIKTEQAELSLIEEQLNWIPVNPLDTRLFINTFPYKRFAGNTRNDIINFILIRAFTYIGITNRGLSIPEIQAMANADCDALLADIPNDIIIESLKTLTSDDFINAEGFINGSTVPLMKFIGTNAFGTVLDAYYYNLIFGIPKGNPNWDVSTVTDAQTRHILPLDKGFTKGEGKNDNEWQLTSDALGSVPLVNKAANDFHFLTNFSTDVLTPKFDDGGVYIKIIQPKDYDGVSVKALPATPPSSNILLLTELKKSWDKFDNSAVGFNQFGGKYGTQEYRVMDFGETGLEKAAFMSVFYQDGNFGNNTFNKSNGLGLKRLTGATTDFDITDAASFFIADGTLLEILGSDSAFDNVIEVIDGDSAVHTSYGKNRLLLNEYIQTKSKDITYPYINFQVREDVDDSNFGQSADVTPVSLFGSRFYYEQSESSFPEHAKALLFLHTFPWNGLIQDEANRVIIGTGSQKNGIFTANEILNTFGNRGGFISAPKLWVAFIGGLLWRSNANESGPTDPILFGNGVDSFIPTYDNTTLIPTRLQYITTENSRDYPSSPMTFSSVDGYKDIEQILLTLPYQAQFEFIQAFNDFVISNNGIDSDWTTIKKQLEVFNGDGPSWVSAWTGLMSDPAAIFDETTNVLYHTKKMSKAIVKSTYNAINNGKSVFDNYIVFTPYYNQSSFDFNFILELKDTADAVNTLLELFSAEMIIANMSYKPWQQELIENPPSGIQGRQGIYVRKDDMSTYIETVLNKIKPKEGSSATDKKKQREDEIFGTDNENIIKLQLYRTCKNLYDKWVGGSDDDNIIFQGDKNNRNGIDSELAAKSRGAGAIPNLIDSFRFVNRSFKDIGDDLIINPIPVGEFLRNNPNSSFYDSVTSLLSANNFDFIALPSYINYGDAQTLESMFKPMSSVDGFSLGTVGPSFVCVYVGQTSKHLDFNGSEYTDDGVNFRCDSNGNLMQTKAKDFTNSAATYENKVAVFAVNYSQQNQNIFKDITLDQSEFSETAESLQIVDDIASKGAENKKTFGGQNLYNVYAVRSYKTEVEMMGNAMIQPMMYFQLNNIPMFHGAYMITHVKHSIKPNTMSTHFTGVRIRNVETPMMDVTELFMSLLDGIESSSVNQTKIAFGTTGSTTSSADDGGVVNGGVVSNTNNNFASGCKAPSKQLSGIPHYTKENPGPNITSTKITYDDLITYLNSTNLTASEKRATYAVAVLEQSKGNQTFNAFGNNLFGFNVEGKYAGVDEAVKEGKILNTFCYGDAESPRVFPQFSMWNDSVRLFSQNIVNPRFIAASRPDAGFWKLVNTSLNFNNNGIKDTDSIELQALKFTVLYFMEWNSPAYKVDVVNSIGNATTPLFVESYNDPTTGNKRSPKHVYDAYKAACVNFK